MINRFSSKLGSSMRSFSLSCSSPMPYRPEERLPLTQHQKRLYPQVEQQFTDEGYPILRIGRSERHSFAVRAKYRRRESRYNYIDREKKMNEKQDWPSIWNSAKSFVPSAVPLPLRQSYEETATKVSRSKHANTELLKIANFLHLTPLAVERHCKALRKFCTEWPEGLETDEEVRSYFPVTYITTDYVNSAPTIRDHRARVVSIKINIKDLRLDAPSEDKLIRLAADRYDNQTGEITIKVSACPVRIQNQDYADYLLTALYFESIRHEQWEDDKPECDWERFFWRKSESKAKAKLYLSSWKPNVEEKAIEEGIGIKAIEDYKQSLEKVYEKENLENLEAYRLSVEELLGMKENKIEAN